MKICYVCPDLGIPLDGHKGASAHVRSLNRAFAEVGHSVVVVSPLAKAGAIPGAEIALVAESNLWEGLTDDVPIRARRAMRHIWANEAINSTLNDLFASDPPDLIYERYSPFGVAGGIAARNHGIPHILEVNSPLAREGAEYRRQALSEVASGFERTAFTNTCAIVAVSSQLRDELVADGVEPSKVWVVPNGVDTVMFKSDGPRYENGLAGKTVIGFVGSLKPWHDIGGLVDAFRLIADDTKYHLLVVGDGPESKRVEALAKDFPGSVTLTGPVKHDLVPEFVRAMDIAVAPYPSLERFYFSPLKVLEYMAAGRAIVTSRIGQIPDLVDDGETGMLIEPGDHHALADAIRLLSDQEDIRIKLGTQAATVARREHAWSHRAADIVNLATTTLDAGTQ